MSASEKIEPVSSGSARFGATAAEQEDAGPLLQVDLAWLLAAPTMLDHAMRRFDSWLTAVEDSESARVLLLTGLACSPSIQEPPLTADQFRRWNKLIGRVTELGALTVCVVEGVCTGRALQLAVTSDFRVGSTSSSYLSTEGRDGLLPGLMTYRLPKLVGTGVAKRLILMGETFSAQLAVDVGLLDYVFPDASIHEDALTLAQQLLPTRVTSLRLARRLIEESHATHYESALGHHLAAYHRCLEVVDR